MTMHEDVVCNRAIEASATAWTSRYHGEVYAFCSLECRERFELEPEDFRALGERATVPTSVALHLVS